MEKFAYKIEDADIWQSAMNNGLYKGSALDVKDGFIHLSTHAQFGETFRRYFAEVPNLIVAKINLAALGDKLKFEPSRGGDLFPHAYCDIPTEAIVAVMPIVCDANNRPLIPQEFFNND